MEFTKAIGDVKKVLESIGSEIDVTDYDGLIVKRLEASNTLDAGRTTKQSHIAITGAQMDMFPYVRADGYFEVDYEKEDANLKKYFVAQIPAYLHKENVEYLGEDVAIASKEQLVHISIVRSRRNNAADQIQMSMTYMDSPKFIEFRRSVHAGSYIVDEKNAIYVMFVDPTLRQLYIENKIVYANSMICINSPQYIENNDNDFPVLTEYAFDPKDELSNTEEIVAYKVILDVLMNEVDKLEEEKVRLCRMVANKEPQRAVAEELGIPRRTLRDRKDKVLSELADNLKDFR